MASPQRHQRLLGTKKLASFSYTKLVIVESLSAKEFSTGQQLEKYISSLESFAKLNTAIEVHDCPTAQSLKILLAKLAIEAKQLGTLPILHIECHGTNTGDGLVLSSGNVIRWTEIAPLIGELNLATKFNLLLFLAACNAFYFIEEMTAIRPSPVYALVAPSDELDPGEVLRGTMNYYRTLFDSGDAGNALSNLVQDKLSTGKWYGRTAEEWFEQTIVNYVQQHCSSNEIAKRARLLYQSQQPAQLRKSVGNLKRALRQKHKVFIDGYFQKCFHTQELPHNLARFDALRKRVDLKVRDILSGPEFRA